MSSTPKILKAGGREMLKTTNGGLLVATPGYVWFYKVTADDLQKLSELLRRRELTSVNRKN